MMEMKKVVSKTYEEPVKCYGCGWRVRKKYCVEGEDVDEMGVCADCFMETFLEKLRVV